ncbi:MAG TPA: HAD family hydrolase [Phaeodactylibacter sp.]|nr:HAD family hydrolase [Phaeodactylibacter sp.]
MKPKLIIFDCDGVLVDTEAISTRVLAEQARELGIEISNQEALEVFAGTNLHFVVDFLGKRLGKKLPDDFQSNYRQRSLEEYKKGLLPIPNIHEVVRHLNIPFCVASNAPIYKIEFNLKLTELFSFFEGKMFSAYEVKAWKPDPTLFLTAAKTMGFSPQDCLVVEDSPSGVRAAVTAKMNVLGYATEKKKATLLQSHGATVISDMREVLKFEI